MGVGCWFDDNITFEVQDDSQNLFWSDSWFDGVMLKTRFGRLFYLVVNKMAMVT